eukprot:9304410-Alexandrium_andersonii.AAC.1
MSASRETVTMFHSAFAAVGLGSCEMVIQERTHSQALRLRTLMTCSFGPHSMSSRDAAPSSAGSWITS